MGNQSEASGERSEEPHDIGVVRVARYAETDPWGSGGVALKDGCCPDESTLVAVWASPADGVAVGRGRDPSRLPDPTASVDVDDPVTVELARYGRRCLARYSTNGTDWHRLGPPLSVPASFRPTVLPFTTGATGTVHIDPLTLRQRARPGDE
ncbi:hypothetical protein [Haloarcula marina]|uniref:hypothetical protein n=1 Tax=Haloarcula marina TaxID=2961574 RepID=UPI0020B8B7D9|nr:hypothetical protein [Halomicroarcula marina]